MKNDKGKVWFRSTPSGFSEFYKNFVDNALSVSGIDWAEGSGYSRGDIISKSGNVTEVRFKSVTF